MSVSQLATGLSHRIVEEMTYLEVTESSRNTEDIDAEQNPAGSVSGPRIRMRNSARIVPEVESSLNEKWKGRSDKVSNTVTR